LFEQHLGSFGHRGQFAIVARLLGDLVVQNQSVFGINNTLYVVGDAAWALGGLHQAGLGFSLSMVRDALLGHQGAIVARSSR